MANFWYDKGLKKILNGDVDVLTDNLKVVLFGSGYSADQDADEFLTSVTDTKGTSGNLASKSVSDGGIFTATIPAITGVTPGAIIYGAACYKDTGVAATSSLLFYIDVAGGLPLTADGTNITFSVATEGLAKI